MFGSDPVKLDSAKRWAADMLDGVNPELLKTIKSSLRSAFDAWKAEYGQAPTPTGLLAALGDESEDFETAPPYRCAGFGIRNNIDLARKLWDDEYGPFIEVINLVGPERLIAVLIQGADIASADSADSAIQHIHYKRAQQIAQHALSDQSSLLKHLKEINQRLLVHERRHAASTRALDDSRAKGSQTTRDRAIERKQQLRQMYIELRKANPLWGRDRYVKYLHERAPGNYYKDTGAIGRMVRKWEKELSAFEEDPKH